jgi:anti-anti-sigma factor
MKSENSSKADGAGVSVLPGKKNDALRGKKPALTLEFEHIDGTVVLHCEGRINFRREFQALWSVIAEVLPSARRLVVDLGGIVSIDSGGLGELVMTHMWAAASGYELNFADPKKPVRELLEITNLLSVIEVYASVPDAMAAMVQESPSA